MLARVRALPLGPLRVDTAMEARDDRQASSRLRPGRDSTLASGIPLATLPGAARAARVAGWWCSSVPPDR